METNNLSSRQRLMVNHNKEYKRYHISTFFYKTASQIPLNLLQNLISQLQNKHLLLRSIYTMDGCREIERPAEGWNLINEYDLRKDSAKQKAEKLALIQKPEIDLSRELPWKIAVIRWNEEETIIGFTFHHVVFDAYSLTKLLSTIFAILQGKYVEILGDDYSIFVDLEKRLCASAEGEKAKIFWGKELEKSRLQITYKDKYICKRDSHKILSGNSSEYGKVISQYEDIASRGHSFAYPISLSGKIRAFCSRNQIRRNILLQYIYMMSIARLNNQKDIVMGNIVTHPRNKKLKNILGPCVNTIFSRLVIEKNMNRLEHLKEFNHTLIRQLRYYWYPQIKILEMKREEWNISPRNFDIAMPVIFNYIRSKLIAEGDMLNKLSHTVKGGIALTGIAPEKSFVWSNTDIVLIIVVRDNEIKGNLRIKKRKFKEAFGRELIEEMKKLLREILE
ncbi:hypothetical protein EPICR_130017 [Candidatus Desulfarcum epimagneticum]|uniref:Condensation domain-containing protein n=1 Tax=uncultured Desulfobacteraceae bacterium TaxID=218296 RepID=A0A484HFI2_9BACT|nr:hypothetical protein EPICR_130017 [uncultured Desulfobacteraceae bacterium]